MPVNKTIRIIIAIALAAVAIVVFFLFSPEESDNFFPKCIFKSITGLDCPGCGSQRAIHHLLHLDFKMAFLRNPLAVTMIPYIFVGILFEYFGLKERFPKARNILFGYWAASILLIIVIAYWIGRNLV